MEWSIYTEKNLSSIKKTHKALIKKAKGKYLHSCIQVSETRTRFVSFYIDKNGMEQFLSTLL
jgi:hypothetical protein